MTDFSAPHGFAGGERVGSTAGAPFAPPRGYRPLGRFVRRFAVPLMLLALSAAYVLGPVLVELFAFR